MEGSKVKRQAGQVVAAARDLHKVTGPEIIHSLINHFTELHGDRLGEDDPAIIGGIGPVSYTHLDVYKRQHLILTSDKVNYSFAEKGKNIFSNFCKVNQITVPCCLDFSERNFHFGGRIGNDLLNYLLEDDLCKLTKSRKVDLCKEPASIVQSVFT